MLVERCGECVFVCSARVCFGHAHICIDFCFNVSSVQKKFSKYLNIVNTHKHSSEPV
jgi:hypothetical protein